MTSNGGFTSRLIDENGLPMVLGLGGWNWSGASWRYVLRQVFLHPFRHGIKYRYPGVRVGCSLRSDLAVGFALSSHGYDYLPQELNEIADLHCAIPGGHNLPPESGDPNWHYCGFTGASEADG